MMPPAIAQLSRFSTIHMLIDKVLLSRFTLIFQVLLPKKQANVRAGGGCWDQVLAISSHAEPGFKQNLKAGTVLIDFSLKGFKVSRSSPVKIHPSGSEPLQQLSELVYQPYFQLPP